MNWLSRQVLPFPYYTICTSKKLFEKTLRKMNLEPDEFGYWCRDGGASTHFAKRDGSVAAIVCIGINHENSDVEIQGLLTHEAVHIYQEAERDWNGGHQGDEVEAYIIQTVSQQLMWEYKRQRGDSISE